MLREFTISEVHKIAEYYLVSSDREYLENAPGDGNITRSSIMLGNASQVHTLSADIYRIRYENGVATPWYVEASSNSEVGVEVSDTLDKMGKIFNPKNQCYVIERGLLVPKISHQLQVGDTIFFRDNGRSLGGNSLMYQHNPFFHLEYDEECKYYLFGQKIRMKTYFPNRACSAPRMDHVKVKVDKIYDKGTVGFIDYRIVKFIIPSREDVVEYLNGYLQAYTKNTISADQAFKNGEYRIWSLPNVGQFVTLAIDGEHIALLAKNQEDPNESVLENAWLIQFTDGPNPEADLVYTQNLAAYYHGKLALEEGK